MRWNALSHHGELKAGAHFYVMEALHVPGGEPPPCTVGDYFRLERQGYWHANAFITEASDSRIVVENVDTKARYILELAAKNEPHIDGPDVPYEEYTLISVS